MICSELLHDFFRPRKLCFSWWFRVRRVTETDFRVEKFNGTTGAFSNRAVFSRLHHDGVVLLLSIAAHQTSVQHQAPLDPSGPIWCDAFSRWNSLAVSRAVGFQ